MLSAGNTISQIHAFNVECEMTVLQKCYYVYILASLSGTRYVGLTDDLRIRIRRHKGGVFDGFTKEYKVDRLMYFEIFHESAIAEAREKQVKKYRRAKKVALFARSNPGWKDLSEEILSRSIKDLLM